MPNEAMPPVETDDKISVETDDKISAETDDKIWSALRALTADELHVLEQIRTVRALGFGEYTVCYRDGKVVKSEVRLTRDVKNIK